MEELIIPLQNKDGVRNGYLCMTIDGDDYLITIKDTSMELIHHVSIDIYGFEALLEAISN
jgi:hypothetical protein